MSALSWNQVEFLRPLLTPADVDSELIAPNLPCVLFCGRSNVGKSSLLNQLCQKKTAFVAKRPGRTEWINLYGLSNQGFHWRIGDLPGFGHAQVSKQKRIEWNHLFSHLFAHLPLHFLCVHIQDARHPMSKLDLEFYSFLRQFPGKKIIVFSKTDRLRNQSERGQFKKVKNKIRQEFNDIWMVFETSIQRPDSIENLRHSLSTELLRP